MLYRQSMTLLAVLGLSASMGTTPAVAHHSLALFDMQKSVRLEGTVKRFDWTNPHSWIFLDVMGPSMRESWTIELPSAGVLAREGWTRNYLRTGERVVLQVNPLKDGRRGGSLERFLPQLTRQSAP
jgi:hypothetical protein